MKRLLFYAFSILFSSSKTFSQSEIEPNNYFGSANTIALNDTFQERILTTADIDYFKITTPRDGIVYLNVFTVPCGPGCCCNSKISLEFNVYGSDTTTLYASSTNGIGGGRYGDMYYPVLLEKGTYYVRVKSPNSESSAIYFKTSFNFDFYCDSLEVNNQFDSAISVPLNTTFNESIYGYNISLANTLHGNTSGQDVDIYKISIPMPNTTLTINLSNIPCGPGLFCNNGMPIEVNVYSASDTTLVIGSKNNSIGGGNHSFQLSYPIQLITGDYYIKIFSSNYAYNSPACFQTSFNYSTLPLKLLDFLVYKSGARNNINWKTAQELNTSHFIIERSINQRDFLNIGKVPAAGNSENKRDYTFIDKEPLQNVNYYRLKMFDKDGKFTYSNIVSLKNSGKNIFSAFPNPVCDNLFVNIQNDKTENATLQLENIEGKILKRYTLTINNGLTSTSIYTKSLKRGIYVLTLKGTNVQKQIIIKQ